MPQAISSTQLGQYQTAIKSRRPINPIALLLSLSLSSMAHAGFEDRQHEEARIGLATTIKQILVKKGVCTNLVDCQKSQFLFASPLKGGIAIQTWGINEASVLEEIAAACASAFFSDGKIKTISIHSYATSKHEALKLPLWNSAKTIYEIEYRRAQQ